MKLALIRQRYNPYGGAERFVSGAMEILRSQGVSVSVLARQWTGPGEGGAGEVIRCDPFYLGRLWRDSGFARAVCERLGNLQFDLVQSHERISCCDVFRAGDGVHAQWLANRSAAGWLARLGTALHPYHRYTLAAERRLFASARLKAVICNSRMVKEEIRRWFGVPEPRLHVIYNGVDLDRFHPRLKAEHRSAVRTRLGIAEDTILFLFVGGGFERKGVAQLLEAFARSGRADASLVIVGDDRSMARHARRAFALGVGDRVHFAGSQEDVRPWYGAADCFVLPTLYDPFPNAVLEALASGLPVITSRQCGAAELIEPAKFGYECGWVCDALDVAELAATLRRLDRAGAHAMGKCARTLAEGFGQAAMGEQLLSLYRGLLSPTR